MRGGHAFPLDSSLNIGHTALLQNYQALIASLSFRCKLQIVIFGQC